METKVKEKKQVATAARTVNKAAVLRKPGFMELQDILIPDPKENEVRIRVEGCGVCASSIPLWEGREWFNYPAAPGAPGHEGWGIIDKTGSKVTGLKTGDRVAFLSYSAFARYDIASADEVALLPPFLDNKPFPGEAIGCAMNIFNRAKIESGQTIAIVGCGFLGLLLIQLAKSVGARVIALSVRKFSLEMALKMGADKIVPMDDHFKVIETVKEMTGGAFCDRVIEATGKEWPLNLSIELTKERGRLIVAGFHQDGTRQVNMQLLNWRGIDLISAHERDPKRYVEGIQNAITAIDKGKLDPFQLFTHIFSLEDINKAFTLLDERPEGFIKTLIVNNIES